MSTAILDFYRGTGTDHAGRRLADILAWGDERLEGVHDYIQWLFPLTEPSAYNPRAPILGREDIDAFHQDPGLRANLLRALGRMLGFYGLACDDLESADVVIGKAGDFPVHAANWLTPHNHNYLRLSRILRSLSLLGLVGQARGLLRCLEGIYSESGEVIGAAAPGYWRRAVRAE